MNRPLLFLLLCVILCIGSACSPRQPVSPETAMLVPAHTDTEDPAAEDLSAATFVTGSAASDEHDGSAGRPMTMGSSAQAVDIASRVLISYGLAADEYDVATVPDPLEGWNRFWFSFNDGLYTAVLQPLGHGYNYVVPEVVRVGVRNFYENLKAPKYIINSLLQGKFKGAGVHMARFIGNTAFGLFGFAGTFNDKKGIVETDREDFGQTLAVWGFGDGFYLVLPILGPTTLRDGVGLGVDNFLDPITYISPWPFWEGEPWQWWVEYGTWAYLRFNEISFSLDYYDDFKATAISPYSAMRNAYIQMRRDKISR